MTIDQTLSDDFQLIPESLIFLMSFRVIVKRLSYGITKTKLHLLNSNGVRNNTQRFRVSEAV